MRRYQTSSGYDRQNATVDFVFFPSWWGKARMCVRMCACVSGILIHLRIAWGSNYNKSERAVRGFYLEVLLWSY